MIKSQLSTLGITVAKCLFYLNNLKIAVNVALKKRAWRYPNDMADYPANLATDGKTDFKITSMSCTQGSPAANPWFLVNLERPVKITVVKILNTDTNRKIFCLNQWLNLNASKLY